MNGQHQETLCRVLRKRGRKTTRSRLAQSLGLGSQFDDFLREEGIYDSVQAVAIKRVIAWQLAQAMKAKGVTKAEMARQMNASRSQIDRLLDPENDSVELQTLVRAAQVLGRQLRLELM